MIPCRCLNTSKMNRSEGEAIHLLHPDGTVTVQFISTQDVDTSYITEDGQERQFITTDESGEYITATNVPAQYILTINSNGELIATGASEFMTGSNSNVYDEDVIVAESEQDEEERVSHEATPDDIKYQEHGENEVAAGMKLVEEEGSGHGVLDSHNDDKGVSIQEPQKLENKEGGSKPPSPEINSASAVRDILNLEDPRDSVSEEVGILERTEQERQNCANCYNKLLLQGGKSKKFSDPLYKGLPVNLLNEHIKKVTVLEAMELLFDLKVKCSLSSIRLCEDYILCYKCAKSLMKLHQIFIEFAEASRSPSFMKSIFSQFGVFTEFKNIVTHVKCEPEERMELENDRQPFPFEETVTARSTASETVNQKLRRESRVILSEITKHDTIPKRKTKSLAPEKPITKPVHMTDDSRPITSIISKGKASANRSSRFPRSCKRNRNYRALARTGSYSESGSDMDHDQDGSEEKLDISQDEHTLVSEDDSEEFMNIMVHKQSETEKQNRLKSLKKRIQLITHESSPLAEKRKPGRPRKIKIEREDEVEKIEIKLEPGLTFLSTKTEDENVEMSEDLEGEGIPLDNPEETLEDRDESISSRGCPLKRKNRKPRDDQDKEWNIDEEDTGDVSGTEENNTVDVAEIPGVNSKRKQKSTGRPIKCTDCCATFQKQSHYADHYKVHSEKLLSCLHCHGSFNSQTNLRRHISINHRIRPERKKISKSAAPPRRFPCPKCNFSFKRLFHLKSHLLNQHEVDPDTMGDFSCPVCSKRFTFDMSLQAHLNRKHVVTIREMKNQCEECGRKFLKKSDLENHLTTHSNIRRFMCEVCGFSSKRPQDLNRHRKLVHTKEVKHICQTCGKGYLSLWQLKSHQLSHEEGKKFPCPEAGCGKAFRCPNNLRQHIQVHQGVKHVCQYCGESYTRTAYLARHISTNHTQSSSNQRRRGRPVSVLDSNSLVDEDSTVPVLHAQSLIKGRKQKNYQLLDNVIQIIEPEPLELDLDIPTEDGSTQQVILHGFDDRYDGVIMEYIIG